MAAYIAKNDSGSFGCVVTSKQCCRYTKKNLGATDYGFVDIYPIYQSCRVEFDLRVIFYEWPKLGLGLDVEVEIQILKFI